MLYDAHNHLQFAELAPHLDAIARDLDAIGLAGAVVNGTHPDEDWDAVATLAKRYPWVVPSYGVHPWDVGMRPTDWQDKFVHRLAADPRAAVGEIGIDRWILEPARDADPQFNDIRRASLDEQLEVCAWQLNRAAAANRAVTIHCLRAWGPLQELLRDTALPPRGFLLHAYGGSPELVPAFAEQGAYFSYSTAHIDPAKTRQRAAFRAVPLDRLLVETDAPAMRPPQPEYTLPDPNLNHPANLAAAYADLAALRSLPVAELTTQVAANFQRLFG